MTTAVERITKWWPILVMAVTLISAGSVAQFQIKAMAAELEDQGESIDENEEQISELQLLLIKQQGDQKREIVEIQGDIKLILRLLQTADQ